jgi:hypothetical protein
MSEDPFLTTEDISDRGPIIFARYGSECTSCGDRIVEGDPIGPDGEGGWECNDCHETWEGLS